MPNRFCSVSRVAARWIRIVTNTAVAASHVDTAPVAGTGVCV